jgi:hypothetical protein
LYHYLSFSGAEMSGVRVVARIRPLSKKEVERDIILTAPPSPEISNTVRIPNPKNEAELYSFQFNSVYSQDATQQQIFDQEGTIHSAIPRGSC